MEPPRKASGNVSEVLLTPSKWLGQYGDFITKNASAVAQIESGLRSLTYIIPGRFRESELASESLHSTIQLLSLYHDSLLSRAVSLLPRASRPHPTPHARYTKYWTSRSPTYARIATLLQTLQYTELLWEMAARRKGEKVRWRVVVLLELVKAVCRIMLLRLTNSRPLLSPPLPQREIDPAKLEEATRERERERTGGGDSNLQHQHLSADGLESPPSERSGITSSSTGSDDAKWTMPRTGLSLPSLPDASDISSYLLSKVLTADDVKPAQQLLHRVTGAGELAELLYILRPVVYALALQHWSSADAAAGGKRNWRPWLLGFGIEFGARELAKREFAERLAGGLRGLTGLEREELRRRGWAMGWWVMRGAFYETITRKYIQSFAGAFRGKPLLDLVATVVDDYDFLWDQYYFPSATL